VTVGASGVGIIGSGTDAAPTVGGGAASDDVGALTAAPPTECVGVVVNGALATAPTAAVDVAPDDVGAREASPKRAATGAL